MTDRTIIVDNDNKQAHPLRMPSTTEKPHRPCRRLRALRRAAGYTETYLAGCLGIKLGYYNAMEMGRIPVWRRGNWIPLARAAAAWFDVDPVALWPVHAPDVARKRAMWDRLEEERAADLAAVTEATCYARELRAAVDATLDAAPQTTWGGQAGGPATPRNRALWDTYQGWNGDAWTLRDHASAAGLTAERVRQVTRNLNAYLRQRCPALAPKELTP
jgi:transcriptional regulator with XRE-family HTH domain